MSKDDKTSGGEPADAGSLERDGSALRKIAEIVRIHELYEGPPCNNKRHSDHLEIATVAHGNDRVTLTLGDCRALMQDTPITDRPESRPQPRKDDDGNEKHDAEAAGAGSRGSNGSAEMAAMLVRWKDRILREAAINIEGHYINAPVEDFTDEEEGFERGLKTAVDEICKLMADPSYFGRSPQNNGHEPRAEGTLAP